jgi:hypothetical protein
MWLVHDQTATDLGAPDEKERIMIMNATDILRAALTAAGCFGAVYLALRYRVPGHGTGTRNARVSMPPDGTSDGLQGIQSQMDADLSTGQGPVRIELTIDWALIGRSTIHINCHGNSSVRLEAQKEIGQPVSSVPSQSVEGAYLDDLPL